MKTLLIANRNDNNKPPARSASESESAKKTEEVTERTAVHIPQNTKTTATTSSSFTDWFSKYQDARKRAKTAEDKRDHVIKDYNDAQVELAKQQSLATDLQEQVLELSNQGIVQTSRR